MISSRLYTIKRIIYLILMYPIVVLMPRDRKKILFGAWCAARRVRLSVRVDIPKRAQPHRHRRGAVKKEVRLDAG